MTIPLTILALALLQLSQAPAATPPAPTLPGPTAVALPADQPNAGFTSAADLLAKLETSGRDLRTLSADIQYTKTFAAIQGGDQQIRRGKLYFQVTPKPAGESAPLKAFSVIFDTLIVGKAVRQTQRHFIFNGTHLVERDLTEKQFLKRRVVKPGERIDPLRLGEGPFPLPIGQRKDEILARFQARLLAPETSWPAGTMPEPLRDTVQLLLVPKPGTPEARDFDEVRLWYRRADLLPRMAKTSTPAGAASEVLLINLAANQPITPGVFDVEPPKEPGWQVDVREEFRGLNEAEQTRKP